MARAALDTSWNLRASTIFAYRHVNARHIAPRLGRRPMEAITTEELRSFFSALSCGPSACASVYRLLAKALNLAVREGVLDRSPLKAIPRPRAERSEIRPLPIEEVEALADAIEPRYRLAVLLGVYLGLRAGEIGGLRLEDLDLDQATLWARCSTAGRSWPATAPSAESPDQQHLGFGLEERAGRDLSGDAWPYRTVQPLRLAPRPECHVAKGLQALQVGAASSCLPSVRSQRS